MANTYFCHECGVEFRCTFDEGAAVSCPHCQSAFVEEIPPEDAPDADDPRDFDPDDAEVNPLDFILGGGGAQAGGAAAGGAGGGPFLQFTMGNGGVFTLGGGGGFAAFGQGGPGGQGGQGGQPAAAAAAPGGLPGLNPLTNAMLQAFGLAPPAQGFPPRAGGVQPTGEGEDAADPEEQQAGGGDGQAGQGRQQVPIRNLASFLGEAFGHAANAHPADDPNNNPFAEGGHERGAENEEGAAQNQQQQPQAGGPVGSLFALLNAFGFGGMQGGFGLAGQAGDYVFGEQNFQQILNDLMEQAAGRAGPQPAPDDMIEKLPRVKITQDLLDADSITTCSICQDAYQLDEEVIALPCKHIYHTDCLVPWLKTSGTCPTCRYALVPQPGQPGYGENAENAPAPGGEAQPVDPTAGGAEASSSAAAPSAARPPLAARQSSLNAQPTSTSRIPEVDGGSSLPGSWVWPAASPTAEEPEDADDAMDVDEHIGGAAGPSGEQKAAASAAAEAAERRARETRERTEVRDEPEIEDVD
ncbi:hypothetical protein JCM10213_008674 [Rhodosporidiobolus nylandii]